MSQLGYFRQTPRVSRLRFNVCFSPKATYLLRGNEMTRRAARRSRRVASLGADVFFDVTTPKFAAQAIKKMAEIECDG